MPTVQVARRFGSALSATTKFNARQRTYVAMKPIATIMKANKSASFIDALPSPNSDLVCHGAPSCSRQLAASNASPSNYKPSFFGGTGAAGTAGVAVPSTTGGSAGGAGVNAVQAGCGVPRVAT